MKKVRTTKKGNIKNRVKNKGNREEKKDTKT